MKYKFALISVLFMAITTPAFAQFGSGIVFDPTNYKNAVLRYLQLQQQLQQLRQSYSLYQQQYQFLQDQTRQLQDMNNRYRAPFSQWHRLTSANTFGNTGQWVNGVNTGNLSEINSGYSKVVPPLPNYPVTDFSPNLVSTIQTERGMMELQDATNVQSLRTIGEIRNNSQQVEAMLNRLESDSLSPDARLNTQVAVLNKINAANIVLARSIQDTNKLLLQLLEQMTQKTAQERGQQGEELSRAVRVRQIMQQSFADAHRQASPSGPFRLP